MVRRRRQPAGRPGHTAVFGTDWHGCSTMTCFGESGWPARRSAAYWDGFVVADDVYFAERRDGATGSDGRPAVAAPTEPSLPRTGGSRDDDRAAPSSRAGHLIIEARETGRARVTSMLQERSRHSREQLSLCCNILNGLLDCRGGTCGQPSTMMTTVDGFPGPGQHQRSGQRPRRGAARRCTAGCRGVRRGRDRLHTASLRTLGRFGPDRG